MEMSTINKMSFVFFLLFVFNIFANEHNVKGEIEEIHVFADEVNNETCKNKIVIIRIKGIQDDSELNANAEQLTYCETDTEAGRALLAMAMNAFNSDMTVKIYFEADFTVCGGAQKILRILYQK